MTSEFKKKNGESSLPKIFSASLRGPAVPKGSVSTLNSILTLYSCWLVIVSVLPAVARNDELSWEHVHHYLYEENTFDKIVISPGPGTPTSPAECLVSIITQLMSG